MEGKPEGKKKSGPGRGSRQREQCSKHSWKWTAAPPAVTWAPGSPETVLLFPRHSSWAVFRTFQIPYHGLHNGGAWKPSRSVYLKVLRKSISRSLISKRPLSQNQSSEFPVTFHLPFPSWTWKDSHPSQISPKGEIVTECPCLKSLSPHQEIPMVASHQRPGNPTPCLPSYVLEL